MARIGQVAGPLTWVLADTSHTMEIIKRSDLPQSYTLEDVQAKCIGQIYEVLDPIPGTYAGRVVTDDVPGAWLTHNYTYAGVKAWLENPPESVEVPE